MITLYGRHGYLRGTRGYHIHLAIGLIVFIVLPLVIIVGWKNKDIIDDNKNMGGVLASIQCKIKNVLGESSIITQEKTYKFKENEEGYHKLSFPLFSRGI